jgi:ABC-type multidrug transport system fused ATPase/permease subunit
MIRALLSIYKLLDKNQKKKFFFLQVLVITTALLEVGSLFLVGQFMFLLTDTKNLHSKEHFTFLYNFFNFSNDQDFFIIFSVITLIFFIITTIISISLIWKLSMYGSKAGVEISIRIYKYFLNQEWLFYTKHNSSTLINKISLEAERVNTGIIQPFMHINAKIILSALIVISIFIYDFFPSLIGLLIFLFSYFILYKTVQKKLYKFGEVISTTQSSRLKILTETFGSIKEILLYGRKNYFLTNYENQSYKYAYASGIGHVLMAVPRYIIELVAISILSMFMIVMVYNNGIEFKHIIPFLTVFGFAVFKLLPALQQIYYGLASIRSTLPSLKNIINEIEASRIKSYEDMQKNYDFTKRDSLVLDKEIVLKNISYHYLKNKDVLIDINMRINKNTTIGVAGPSGCGKSTLADIIIGLIKPLKGNIFYDGKILEDKKLERRWQNNIGYVSQSIYLIDASISENIFFGMNKEDIDFEKLKKCLEISNLNDFINGLPNGVDTIIGENGIQLSGGQRQRIAIARAIYHDVDFLVFDEATSSLDGLSEKKIMDAIKNLSGQKTILIIAHRLSTLKNCNTIYFMENGKIVDSGNYSYLISKNKLFKKMSENYN